MNDVGSSCTKKKKEHNDNSKDTCSLNVIYVHWMCPRNLADYLEWGLLGCKWSTQHIIHHCVVEEFLLFRPPAVPNREKATLAGLYLKQCKLLKTMEAFLVTHTYVKIKISCTRFFFKYILWTIHCGGVCFNSTFGWHTSFESNCFCQTSLSLQCAGGSIICSLLALEFWLVLSTLYAETTNDGDPSIHLFVYLFLD